MTYRLKHFSFLFQYPWLCSTISLSLHSWTSQPWKWKCTRSSKLPLPFPTRTRLGPYDTSRSEAIYICRICPIYGAVERKQIIPVRCHLFGLPRVRRLTKSSGRKRHFCVIFSLLAGWITCNFSRLEIWFRAETMTVGMVVIKKFKVHIARYVCFWYV